MSLSERTGSSSLRGASDEIDVILFAVINTSSFGVHLCSFCSFLFIASISARFFFWLMMMMLLLRAGGADDDDDTSDWDAVKRVKWPPLSA